MMANSSKRLRGQAGGPPGGPAGPTATAVAPSNSGMREGHVKKIFSLGALDPPPLEAKPDHAPDYDDRAGCPAPFQRANAYANIPRKRLKR